MPTKNGIDLIDLIDIITSDSSIILLGVEHSYNIRHSQFNFIKRVIIKEKPDLILVESEVYPYSFATEGEAIKKGGERAFIKYICDRYKIAVDSSDPTEQELFSYLYLKYGKVDLMVFYVLRELSGSHITFRGKSNLLVNKALEYFNPLAKTNFSAQDFWKRFKDITKKVKLDKYIINRLADPNQKLCILNEIALAESKFRDDYTINKIKNIYNKKIILIKGAYHIPYIRNGLKV